MISRKSILWCFYDVKLVPNVLFLFDIKQAPLHNYVYATII